MASVTFSRAIATFPYGARDDTVCVESTEPSRVSQLLIQHDLNELQTLRRVSGTSRESVVREAFKDAAQGLGPVARSHFHPRV